MDIGNILKEVEAIKKGDSRSDKKTRSGIILKRNGSEIKNTIVRKKVKPVLSVKKDEVVNRSELSSEDFEDWYDDVKRRKLLGKSVYEKREDNIRLLVSGYSVDKTEVEKLSLNGLLIKVNECRVAEAKALDTLKKSKIEYDERLGEFYKSFKLVYKHEMDVNSEQWKIKTPEKDDEQVVVSRFNRSFVSIKEREERWERRKAVIQAKQEEERYLFYACRDFTSADIAKIESGDTEKWVDPEAVKKAEERKELVESLIEKGMSYTDAEAHVKMVMMNK